MVLHAHKAQKWELLEFFSATNPGLKFVTYLSVVPRSRKDADWVQSALSTILELEEVLPTLEEAFPSLRGISCETGSLPCHQLLQSFLVGGRSRKAESSRVDRFAAWIDEFVFDSNLPRTISCQRLSLRIRNLKPGNALDLIIGCSSSKRLKSLSIDFSGALMKAPRDTVFFTVLCSRIHDWRIQTHGLHQTFPNLTFRFGNFGSGNALIWSRPCFPFEAFARMTMLVLQDCLRCSVLLDWMEWRMNGMKQWNRSA